MHPKNNNRSVWAWACYDWANSTFSTTVITAFFPIFFKAYYSAGDDVTMSTAKLGVANAIGTALVAFLSPLFGSVADKGSFKKKFLAFFAFSGCVLTSLLTWVGKGDWQWAVAFYVLANIAWAASFSFYDSLLPEVSDDKSVHKVSSMGYSLGYLGGGILLALNAWMYLSPQTFGLVDGADGVKKSFLTVSIWWFVFTIPLLLFVHETKSSTTPKFSTAVRDGLAELKNTFQHLSQLKMTFLFLLAFLIYNDGIGTVFKMSVDYGMSIGLAAGDLIKAVLIVQFVGFPATLLIGYLCKWFSPKKAILACLALYTLAIFWATKIESANDFYMLAILIGCILGPSQALSRSFYTFLIPKEKAGEFFGFYNLLGRFTGIIGPIMMGLIGTMTGNPRDGIFSIAILFIVGGFLLWRVNPKQAERELAQFQ